MTMHPDIKTRWLDALRSGTYHQTRTRLRQGKRYCVFGVLCDLSLQEPSPWQWRYIHREGWHFGHFRNTPPYTVYNWWAGIPEHDYQTLLILNDDRATFAQLADWIDEHL